MKNKKLALFMALTLSVGAFGGAIALQNIDTSFFSKGFAKGSHETERSLTITAADIANAIGAGSSGNFTVCGLEWFVAGASVTDGVVNINQGTLYNVTLAGATKTDDNWMGTGFTGLSLKNYTVPGGAPAVHAKNGDAVLKSYFPSGEASASKDVSFADAGGMVNRVEIAFGAGGGTSFTSLVYNYTCAEYIPPAHQEIELEVSNKSYISAGQIFTYLNAPEGKTGSQIAGLGLSEATLSGIDTEFIETIVQDPTTTDFRIYTPVKNAALTSSQFNIHFEFEDAINNITYVATAYYADGILEAPVRLSGASSAEVGVNAYQTAIMASYLSGTPTYSFTSSDTSVATVAANGNQATITPLSVGTTTITVTMTLNEVEYIAQKEIQVTAGKLNLFKLTPGAVRSGTEIGEGNLPLGEYTLWTDCSSTASATANTITFNINKGGAFWSSQFFWNDPYKDGSRKYHITALVNASNAGTIRINNVQSISLDAGDNILDIDVNNNGTASLGIFFGNVSTDTSYQGVITFTNLRITDRDNDRFEATFNYYNGSSVVLDAFPGAKLYKKPSDDTREGYEFMSWQIDGVDVDLNTYTFSESKTLTARFEESGQVTKYTVTVKEGSTTIAEIEVNEGAKADLSSLNNIWAHNALYFTDSELTEAFDTNTLINSNLTIYRGAELALPSTFNDYTWQYSCTRSEGNLNISFVGENAADGWHGQINYENIPVGESGKTYRITMSYSTDTAIPYKFCKNYGDYHEYQIGALTVGNNQTLVLNYEGNTIDAVNKLTFEVASLSNDAHSLTIHSIQLVEVA